MKRYLKDLIACFEGFYTVLELLWVVPFVLVGPFIWMYWLFRGNQFKGLVIVAALWLLSLAVIRSDVRTKAVSPFSLGIFLIWLVVLAFVFSMRVG